MDEIKCLYFLRFVLAVVLRNIISEAQSNMIGRDNLQQWLEVEILSENWRATTLHDFPENIVCFGWLMSFLQQIQFLY